VNSPVIPSLLFSDTRLFFSHPEPSDESTSQSNKPDCPKILVIDDEMSIADTLAEILSGYGFDAFAFYGGQSAIDFARNHCPDIVISDIVMPKLDGIETVIAIRELCPSTRILLFSGQANISQVMQHARERGHDFELLPKPVHPDVLVKKLSELK
jgi:DNA-binding NtrC family response regulator